MISVHNEKVTIPPSAQVKSKGLIFNPLRHFIKKSIKTRSMNPDFRYAKLNDCNGAVEKGREWYFYFYILDPTTNKYKRFIERFDINRIRGKNDDETRKLRYTFAKGIIKQLNELLDEGKYKSFIVEKTPDKDLKAGMVLAVKLKLNKNLRHRSIQTYQNVADRFFEFIETKKIENKSLSSIERKDIIEYRDYLLGRGISNLTANKYLTILHSLFQELVEREYLKINPVANIKKLDEVDGEKNIPFTADELISIIEHLPAANKNLYTFFLFIYYCMMRSNEICQLQLSMIDFQNGLIHLPASVTKTKRTRVVKIMPEFIDYLKSEGYHLLKPSAFLFSHSKTLAPGDKPAIRNRVSEHWKKEVKEKLGINKDMYAAKHTAAKIFRLNGGSVESLQSQMGHETIQTTEIYLRKILPQESLQRFAKEYGISGVLSPKIQIALREGLIDNRD